MPESIRFIAIYLPQFHTIPENDEWWGKGFTEWTNVGKAKPLFRGHYQPKVPADLGYYDLRLPETREDQANLAKEYGIEGFCYWHYWFGHGRKILQRPFEEVLSSGKPDFPFCLAWANHDWYDKTFSIDGKNKLLLRQEYPGKEDYTEHFNYLLPAFKDPRYIKVNGNPFFMIFSPKDIPDIRQFIDLWQSLAKPHGFQIHFVGRALNADEEKHLLELGFDAIMPDRTFAYISHLNLAKKAWAKICRIFLHRIRRTDYGFASQYFLNENIDKADFIYPQVLPNWDRTPRAGKIEFILTGPSPKKFQQVIHRAIQIVREKPYQKRIVIIRSWNEWAEGNYMEPCIKYGRGYLQAIKNEIENT